ncbi:hypothetical protein EC973_003620 [Apophysomyces ossiformis]|uniref:Uncharacterized protein n=1 Tax=Apophysomyces ossiformis TaxID=679940 RepID=A0A8H7BXT2_9FUNG|nr:hypothetical protein EC973_003620 [Apophysomyces ossiformis]
MSMQATEIIVLTLGHQTILFSIGHSVKTDTTSFNSLRWPYDTTLSVIGFVAKSPTTSRTISRHVLEMAPNTTPAEQDVIGLFSKALKGEMSGQRCFAIVRIDNSLIGSIGYYNGEESLVLCVIEQVHPTRMSSYSPFSMEMLRSRPFHILQLCRQREDPNAVAHLRALANDTYNIASLYGYWDLWRVLEEICFQHQINPRELLPAGNTA